MEKIYKQLKIGILVVIMVQFSQHAFATGVRLSWQPNTESDVAGYKVYYGTASRDYDNVIDVGNVDTVDIGDLENTEYFFAVTAYNDAGEESGFSEEWQAILSPDGQGSVIPGAGADPSVDSSETGASSGGGGGGGCFINASSVPGSSSPVAACLSIICLFILSLRRTLNIH